MDNKNLIENPAPTTELPQGYTGESQGNEPEWVNHPIHYNNYNVEVIDMMEKIWGTAACYFFCTLNAFKYRMRMGTKPGEGLGKDLEKEQWYLKKAQELKAKLEANKK